LEEDALEGVPRPTRRVDEVSGEGSVRGNGGVVLRQRAGDLLDHLREREPQREVQAGLVLALQDHIRRAGAAELRDARRIEHPAEREATPASFIVPVNFPVVRLIADLAEPGAFVARRGERRGLNEAVVAARLGRRLLERKRDTLVNSRDARRHAGAPHGLLPHLPPPSRLAGIDGWFGSGGLRVIYFADVRAALKAFANRLSASRRMDATGTGHSSYEFTPVPAL
jgi:hypothetical protein